ncbi:MAG: hypothetical protein Q4Q04_01725 [Methanocorpusculum sp.]|nr:hypothetical protein [Methanocorpusculum sp.]
MTDLRTEVEEDRGLLKKIQLMIPGFRGYRQREDIRIADSLLRMQIADMMKNTVLLPLEQARETASRGLELDLMNDFAAVISKAKAMEGRIRHAEQGYSGISAGIRIEQKELNTLYEYDAALLDSVAGLGNAAASALRFAEAGEFDRVKSGLASMKAELTDFSGMFDKRTTEIAGISVV